MFHFHLIDEFTCVSTLPTIIRPHQIHFMFLGSCRSISFEDYPTNVVKINELVVVGVVELHARVSSVQAT